MAKGSAKVAPKPAASSHTGDIDMSLDPVTPILPPAEIADGTDDPMADPVEPQDDEEAADAGETFDPEVFDEEDEEASNISASEEEDASDIDDDLDMDGGAPLTTRESLSPSAVPLLGTTLPTDPSTSISTSIHVEKPTPYTHDAGHLLITDPNPLPPTTASSLETTLTATARDAAQSLLNHLLTTCPIHTLSTTTTSASGVEMTLPPPTFLLPREKKIPVPKPPTRWEQFAKKKGIGAKNAKNAGAGDGERAGKMVYDEGSGEWVPRWGYKGRNKKGEGDWLVEVDEEKERKIAGKKEGPVGIDPRAASRGVRKERVRRNERAQRANERKGRRGGA